jgi:hypothetical protein
LNVETLVQYLEAHQPDLLNRLKIHVRIKEDLARALKCLERSWARLPRSPSPGPASPPGVREECLRGVGG